MKIRLKDIAEMAGVSLTAVSLVLNNKPSRISQEKKDEIIDIAKKYNYIPNYHAKSLATRTSNIIGIIVPNIENPFFASLVKLCQQRLLELGYMTLIMNSNDQKENDIKFIEKLNQFSIDGLIIVFSNHILFDHLELKNVLDKITCPYIVIDRSTGISNHKQVSFDDFHGGYLATRHLIKLGHKNIGALMANNTLISSKNRHKGYLKALSEYGLKPRADFYVETKITFEDGYKNSEILFTKKKISAIFAVNDLVALGSMKKAKELSIKVPEEISIIGYDNLIFNNYIETTLSSVQQDIDLLVENSIQLLLDNKSEQIVIKPSLKLGQSTSINTKSGS